MKSGNFILIQYHLVHRPYIPSSFNWSNNDLIAIFCWSGIKNRITHCIRLSCLFDLEEFLNLGIPWPWHFRDIYIQSRVWGKKVLFLGINHLCKKIAAPPFLYCRPSQLNHERAQSPTGQCLQPRSPSDQLSLGISSQRTYVETRANKERFHLEYESVCYIMDLSGQNA